MSKCNKCPKYLEKTKSKKSCKKICPSSSSSTSTDDARCEVNCCIKECNPNCCTIPFQRLDKLRNQWMNVNMYPSFNDKNVDNEDDAVNRGANVITPPSGSNSHATPTYLQYNNPVAFGDTSGTVDVINGNNEMAAYMFVNIVRYLNFEECGKQDQVLGWSVNVQTGELVMYQNLEDLNITVNTSRANLLSYSVDALTSQMKIQLRNLEPFWKLSLKAIERVGQNPKEEGNICELSDKCGNKYLIAINRATNAMPVDLDGFDAALTSATSVCNYTGNYTIVAIKLC